MDAGEVTSGQLFGTREYLQNNYLYRMAAAVLGIYGNSKAEAMYPLYSADADGQTLDGANRYTLRFAPGQLPPVNAFWSLTMYELPEPARSQSAEPLPDQLSDAAQLEKDPDGGLTLMIQNDSPGAEKEANWLPAPKGPFMMAMRLYWPKDEALDRPMDGAAAAADAIAPDSGEVIANPVEPVACGVFMRMYSAPG